MRIGIWSCPRLAKAAAAARVSALVLGLILSLTGLRAEPHWKIQFFFDRADSNFDIEDLECPTPQHCAAAGIIDDKNGHRRGAVVVTSDGGQHWSQYETKEQPVSLFFLNDSLGWMVTEHGLWSTVEGGRAWSKLESRKGILQTYFLDPSHGYIAGLEGLVEETADGGKTWVKLAPASEHGPDGRLLNYELITFQGLHGVIVGATQATSPVAIRRNPVSGLLQREPVSGVTMLETLDGGKKWTLATIPMDGELAQLRISKQGFAVTLVLYSDPKYSIGSAVFRTILGSSAARVVFAERDRVVTDIALLGNGGSVVAAIEPPGNSTQVPIPGKLKMLESHNLKVWREMPVDYRAVAQRAVIAAPDSQHMWVATDTGAILSLVD